MWQMRRDPCSSDRRNYGSGAGRGNAADPQPYSVTLEANREQDPGRRAARRVLVDLTAGQGAGRGFSLVERARQDVDRFQTVLQSYGYYEAKVNLTIAGHPVSDPTLPDIVGATAGRTQAGDRGEF